MTQPVWNRRKVCFDGFEADLHTGELHKFGQKISVPEKSFQLLALLLERAGEMVSRKEICHTLWKNGVNVDYDHNLNNAVARLRQVLADSAENPRYIETIASRGYRFIAIVTARKKDNGRIKKDPYKFSTAKGGIRIAVLPFENYCPESDCPSWLSDGLTEEVIERLGQLSSSQLSVIARTAILKYKGTRKDISQIGRDLNVSHVMEGSVRCLDDCMHVMARLVRVEDQAFIWAERYEYQLGDILRAQIEAAVHISQAVALQLSAVSV